MSADIKTTEKTVADLDIDDIMRMIPHRYPMLLLDRVEDVVPGVSCTGVKNVTINEHFFQGHFPQRPVMPGVLIVETMAQTAAVLVIRTVGDELEQKLVYFMSMDKVRFRHPVQPGDQLRIKAEVLQHRRNVWKFQGKAMVDGKPVAEAVYSAMIMDY